MKKWAREERERKEIQANSLEAYKCWYQRPTTLYQFHVLNILRKIIKYSLLRYLFHIFPFYRVSWLFNYKLCLTIQRSRLTNFGTEKKDTESFSAMKYNIDKYYLQVFLFLFINTQTPSQQKKNIVLFISLFTIKLWLQLDFPSNTHTHLTL